MTNIEWTDETWNPVRGCTRVSPGCQNCYAERQAIRHAGAGGSYEGLAQITNGHPQWTGKLREVQSALEMPFHWKKPRRVFVNSMSDLFHPDISREFLVGIFGVMAETPQHTYQILTKRPEHMVQVMPFVWDILGNAGRPLENVWLGVSVENQHYADARTLLLQATPAAVRFLSIEPQLDKVTLEKFLTCTCGRGVYTAPERHMRLCGFRDRIHWVICGGESGPGARPFNLAWAESLLKECRAAAVPFFLKQVGAVPMWEREYWNSRPSIRLLNANNAKRVPDGFVPLLMNDRKGGNLEEWPSELQVREFPSQKAEALSA